MGVKVWRSPESALLLIRNTTGKSVEAFLDVDLVELRVKVTEKELWERYTQIFDLEGKKVRNVLWEEIQTSPHHWNRAACFDRWIGRIAVRLEPGETRNLCIDKN